MPAHHLKRGIERQLPRGQSGNPGGRPKIFGDIRALAREHIAEARATLVRLAKTAEREETPAGRGIGFA